MFAEGSPSLTSIVRHRFFDSVLSPDGVPNHIVPSVLPKSRNGVRSQTVTRRVDGGLAILNMRDPSPYRSEPNCPVAVSMDGINGRPR